MTQENQFVSVSFFFAGTEKKKLTIFAPHVLTRTRERMRKNFNSSEECAEMLGEILTDPRLAIILEKVPLYSRIAMYIEKHDIYIFMQMGTLYDSNEIKVATIYCRSEKQERILVDEKDLCYILPCDGELRFGKEKKYFALKKNKKKL